MWVYIARRMLYGVPILIGVTLITFLLLDVFGGDPAIHFLGKAASHSDIQAFRIEHGLDRHIAWRYLDYLQQIVTLDFGRSYATHESVTTMIGRGLFPSLAFTVPALVLTTLLAVSISLVAASVRGSRLDRGLMAVAVLGMSISFLVYILVGQYLLAYVWPLFHIHGYESGIPRAFQYVALPIIILIVVGLGYDTRFYRSVFAEEMTRDHVITALAKGASHKRVLFIHVLKNALIPITTRVMISLPFLITGSILIESFFGIPGLGHTLLSALESADHPVVRAFTAIFSILFIISTILNDIVYALVDPRVRLE
jgi:peptide/nickel transport system permease protein